LDVCKTVYLFRDSFDWLFVKLLSPTECFDWMFLGKEAEGAAEVAEEDQEKGQQSCWPIRERHLPQRLLHVTQ
jgi:hypothetical protein